MQDSTVLGMSSRNRKALSRKRYPCKEKRNDARQVRSRFAAPAYRD